MTIVGETPAVAPRRCGRCRQLFDGDPTLHAAAIPDWWLCATCRLALGIDRPGPARAGA
jgi:hypothetical protein